MIVVIDDVGLCMTIMSAQASLLVGGSFIKWLIKHLHIHVVVGLAGDRQG